MVYRVNYGHFLTLFYSLLALLLKKHLDKLAYFLYHIIGGSGISVLEPVDGIDEHAADDHTRYSLERRGYYEPLFYAALKASYSVVMVLVYEGLEEYRAHGRSEDLGDSRLVLVEEADDSFGIVNVVFDVQLSILILIELCVEGCAHVLDYIGNKVELIVEMLVEGRASDARSVTQIIYRDIVELNFCQHIKEGAVERVLGFYYSQIFFTHFTFTSAS